MNTLRELLSANLGIRRIHEIYTPLQGNTALLETFCALCQDEDKKVSTNALWVMTHFSKKDTAWLLSKSDFLIDSVLQTGNEETGRRRMLLSILAKHKFEKKDIRTDFLNYCLEHIMMDKESTANRCRCMELAYEQCKLYPELLTELESVLDIVGNEPMTPAVNCTRRKILKLTSKTLTKQPPVR